MGIPTLSYVLSATAIRLPRLGRSIWLHGDSVRAFQAQETFITTLRERHRNYRIALTVPGEQQTRALARVFPNDFVFPASAARGLRSERFLSRVAPYVTILLDATSQPNARLVRALRARGIGLVILSDVQGQVECEPLASMLPPPCPIARGHDAWWSYSAVSRFAKSKIGQRVGRVLLQPDLTDLSNLRRYLGDPRTVLCLGNGPSASEAALNDLTYDCLIRSNYRWRAEPRFNRADVVVVGDFDTLAWIRDSVFAYRSREAMNAALLRAMLRFARGASPGIDLQGLLSQFDHLGLEQVPSSGALTVVLACALKPERLVIGGIDLFEDERGRYANASGAVNAYAQAHSRYADLSLIRAALQGFQGQLIIIGDVLRTALGNDVKTVTGKSTTAQE